MAESKMQLEDWLDDLCVRFIINLPREELESVERICFQVEEAQWFYEDFIRPLDPNLPSLSLRAFALRIFQHCPLMSQWSHYHHSTAFSEFLAYKTRVPVRGAILLNQEMDEVVLVKGWKKGASWSFPRGKINKDEKDLDCAIREVYEETGFDIRAAGLIKDEKHIKHIEINMREQNMRLYVFSGVPRETRFEPRTRKEISRIEWVKLSDLPTLKKPAHKKNKQAEADNQNNLAGNASKFYMVAPFLFPLKKWIARQKKLELANNPNLHPPMAETSAGEGFTEEEGIADYNAAPMPGPGEEWFPSDLPEVSLTDDPSVHLKRLLNISDLAALQPSQASFATQPRLQPQPQASAPDKGSALLDLLRKGSTPVPPAPEPKPSAAPEPAQPSMPPQASFAELSSAPHAHVPQMGPGQGAPMMNFQTQQMHWPSTGPPQRGQFPYAHGSLPAPGQPHQVNRNNIQQYPPISFPQQANAARYMGNQPPQMPHLPQMARNVGMPPSAAQLPAIFAHSAERRHTPAPYQRTGDPEFSQAAQSSKNNVSSVPPASKLPPPKLTSHSLALLNVFKGQSNKAAVSEELPTQQNGDKLPVGDKAQQQEKLLSLLRKSKSPAADAPIPSSSPGCAELAASSAREDRRPDTKKNIANGPVELLSKGKGPAGDKDVTSARVSGPLNLPDFEGVARSAPKVPTTRPVPRPEPKPKANITILPRPKTAERESSAATQETPSPRSPQKRTPEPSKPFQPKILRRPVKEDMEASLPSDTVTVSAFSLPSRDKVLERERKPSAELNIDRRPSQTAAQKEALLSLFGKPNPPTHAAPAPSVETANAVRSPPQSTIISPVEKLSLPPSRKNSTPQHSRIGSISPTASAGAEAQPVNRSKATSPVNKAFLLGYLEGVAKGKH